LAAQRHATPPWAPQSRGLGRPDQPSPSNGSVLPLLVTVRAHFGKEIGGFQCPRSRIFTDRNEKRHLPKIEPLIRKQRAPHFTPWRPALARRTHRNSKIN